MFALCAYGKEKMMRKIKWSLTLAALAMVALAGSVRAADAVPTTITVEDMHCMGCAKKIAAQLYKVPGVAAIKADVPSSRLVVQSKPQQNPSPKAMWEAVEQAGYKPAKLEGAAGTFTAKPQS